jgi:AbrB family looped-hinge helix DNA binding protein
MWYCSAMSHRDRRVVLGDRGRVVLPSDVRAQLNLEPGTPMLLRTEPDGSLRLRPYRSVAERHRGMLADLSSSGESLVDELVAERRREAAREDEE